MEFKRDTCETCVGCDGYIPCKVTRPDAKENNYRPTAWMLEIERLLKEHADMQTFIDTHGWAKDK